MSALSLAAIAAAPGVAHPSPPPTTAPAARGPGVYVLPFTSLTPGDRIAWAGRAVQESLVADLTRAGYTPVTANAPLAQGADAPAAARLAGATYAVTGSCQFNGGQVRLTGELTDAGSGRPLAGLSATGDGQGLFALEDRLSAQLVNGLRHDRPTADQVPRAPRVPAALRPAVIAAAVQPPAGGLGSHYQGSALQSYVDANRTPSQDYTQQVIDARDCSAFGSYNSAATGYGGGNGIAAFGFGGGFGGGYGGGYGYGLGSGGYLLGVSYPVGSVGTFGVGGYGYQGFGGVGGGFRGGFGFAGGRGSIGFGGGFGRGGGGGFR